MSEYQSEIIGNKPSNLVIFLHGYNGTLEDHKCALDWLRGHLENTVLFVPLAPEICDKNPEKRQWFGMLKHDAECRRYAENASVPEIMEIYNRTQTDISARADDINKMIINLQKQHNIAPQNTYIIGFSQGAMLALYTALSDENISGGVFMLSGLVAAEKYLSSKIKSHPFTYLFHGENDKKVQYKTLAFTDDWLNKNGVAHRIFTYPELAHKISEDEILTICKIINKKAA